MKIYISYRRADSQYIVGRIRDRLIAAFGENSVFTDVEDIPVGEDFREVLDRAVKECNVMLVVIGPQWADITDADGKKRLSNSSDYTRIEIEKGLQREGVPVIPVLVMNARMPSPQELPQSLNELVYRNAIALRNDPDFDTDMRKLIDSIQKIDKSTGDVKKTTQAQQGKSVSRTKKTKAKVPSEQISVGGDISGEIVIGSQNFVVGAPGGAVNKSETPISSSGRIGSYEIRTEIGRGSRSTVYHAYDPSFAREVALKLLHQDLLKEPGMQDIFEREAKTAIMLKHEAIVPVYDFGHVDDKWFIVMQYMRGGSLFQRVHQGKIALSEVYTIIHRIASGIDYAHEKGVIHRNLKSRNILFDEDNNAYISNFGLGKIAGEDLEEEDLTGTPAYMSPEQARGQKVAKYTDIYSLGIILYEMLTGVLPFQADTTFGLLLKHINEPPPLIKGIPTGLQALIDRALAKDPTMRFENALDLARELRELLQIEESETERAIRLQAAVAANLLSNNRSQAVFNDKAQGEDQLGIKNEVEALAETLLLRDVEPPVAVGVMGGWGSGKSFVMYLIDQYVQAIRAQKVKKGWANSDEKDPKIPVFVGHVYQIHFNAWTYAKSNLWASLMDTIFSCLNRQMQLERLLAHREFSPDKPPSKEQIHASMLMGGDEFKKIYMDNPQLGQDKDLEKWRKNLEHWSQQLLKGTLLWNVMRGQQVETLEKLKDTEEQLNQLKTRREQFEKDRPLNAITTNSIKDATARHAYFQSIKSFMLAFLSDQLSATAKEELKKQDVKEEDVQKFLEEAKGLSGGVTTLVTAFRQSKIYLFWTVIFLLLFIATPYLWSKYALDFIQPQIAQTISLVLTLLPTLRVIVPWIKKSTDASIESKKILEGAYATQQAKRAEKIANAADKPIPQKISELQAEISNGSLPAYDALIGLMEAQAEEQRAKIGPSAKYSNLMEFVQSRLDAATYENQLGLMHQVRQDIDELTYSLVDNASPEFFHRGKPRVILYIDDLDRCPPPRVVEMLEAVQLLLNTKLFIVILGLDTRYVTRALEKEYKEILQHEGDPSGLDYIEKIIQIPYRVRAIEQDSLRQYIEKQMDIEKAPEPAPAVPSSPPFQDAVLQDAQPEQIQPESRQALQYEPAQEQPAGEIKAPPQSAEPVQPSVTAKQDEASQSPKPLEIELPTAVIQFKQEDLEDLAVCCQKIALTPRSIKRLVNVFKLMKIFWFRADKDAGIAERDRPRAVKQAAMSLLALSSAYPEVMREVFVHLDTLYRQGREQTELFTALNNIKLPPGSTHELSWQLQKYKADISALEAIVGNGQDKFGQLTVHDLKLSTFNLVRSFSFVGDPVYWTDDEADQISSSNGDKPQPVKAKRNKNGK